MEESKFIHWHNLASTNINLRYPNISLQVISPFNTGYNNEGRVMLQTFIQSKNKERLTLVQQDYITNSYEDIFIILEKLKKSFDNLCELTKKEFIFNKEWSIEEPFGTNKMTYED